MIKTFRSAIALFILMLFPLMGEEELRQPSLTTPTYGSSHTPQLMINNRPLAKINGKVISLYDVIKKMDLFLFEYAPEATLLSAEKYQFYMSRWETTLDEMIADELILMDAAKKEVKISDGEVREMLQERFGPNIRASLDKVNLEYDEARDLIRSNLIVNQLIGMKVHAKAFHIVTPELIKEAYTSYVTDHPPQEQWKYQVLSIRGEDPILCGTVAQKAYEALLEKKQSLDTIATALEAEEVTLNASEDYLGETKKISKAHFEVIQSLTPGSISKPISQVSRYDKSGVLRIFHLKDVTKSLPETFDEMHDTLKNQLLFQTSDSEKKHYIESLSKRFGYATHSPKFLLPEDYHPFLLF